jgi:PEGA domain
LGENTLMRMVMACGLGAILACAAPMVARAQQQQQTTSTTTNSGNTSSSNTSTSSTGGSAGVGTTTTTTSKTTLGENSATTVSTTTVAATPGAAPTHVAAPTGPPIDEVNRKELEKNAGKDAGKLFLRSTPTGAQIYINGNFVGKSPLLLVVPPGTYKVEMRGPRQGSSEKIVGLLASQTQEVLLNLALRYPARVTAQ